MEAVKQNGKAIDFASPILKENEEILIKAIKNGYINIPPDTEKRHHVKLILERNGHYLKRFEKRYLDDKELVLAAVTQHGHAIKYASDRLKGDDEILTTAISNYPGAIKFLPEKLKYEEKYIKKAFDCLKIECYDDRNLKSLLKVQTKTEENENLIVEYQKEDFEKLGSEYVREAILNSFYY